MEDQVRDIFWGTELKYKEAEKIRRLGILIQKTKQVKTSVTGTEEEKVEKKKAIIILKYQEIVFPEQKKELTILQAGLTVFFNNCLKISIVLSQYFVY